MNKWQFISTFSAHPEGNCIICHVVSDRHTSLFKDIRIITQKFLFLQRYFVLEKGILRYSKDQHDVSKMSFVKDVQAWYFMHRFSSHALLPTVFQREIKRVNGCQSRSDVSKQKGKTDRLGHWRQSLSHQGKQLKFSLIFFNLKKV